MNSKHWLYSVMILASIAFFLATPKASYSQGILDDFKGAIDELKQTEEKMRFYREKYDTLLTDTSFEEVWNGVMGSLENINCFVMNKREKQDDDGLLSGTIKSEFCVFANEAAYLLDTLAVYSIKVPVIRGGRWVSGRVQYTFVIKENEDFSIYFRIKGELSGKEDYVTHEVHFWESNGFFETTMLNNVVAKVYGTKSD